MATSYVTTRGRRVGSVFLGAAIGGLVTATPIVLMVSEDRQVSVESISIGVMGSLLGWLLGIVVLGVPVWLFSEHQKWGSSRRAAAICGITLPPLWFLVFAVLMDVLFPGHSGSGSDGSLVVWIVAFSALPLAVIGCGVGVAMWRFAYRPRGAEVADTFA